MEKNYKTLQETKKHGRPDFLFNIYPCTIPLDFPEVATHWHDDVELISIRKGNGTIDLDFTSHPVCAGDLVLVRPGQLHAIHFDGVHALEYENILIAPSFLLGSDFDATTHTYMTPFLQGNYQTPQIFRQETAGYDDFMRCIHKIDSISEKKSFAWEVGIKSGIYDFFYLLFSNYPMTEKSTKDTAKTVALKNVLTYIEKNYPYAITIADVSALLGYSSSYFMRFFKEQTNQTFVTYLNDFRLSKAAELLCDTDDSVLAISIACGYDNISLFNRQFKRKYSQTPSAFRQIFGNP